MYRNLIDNDICVEYTNRTTNPIEIVVHVLIFNVLIFNLIYLESRLEASDLNAVQVGLTI